MMWGNALGWCISIAIVLATVSAIAFVQQRDQQTPSTEFSRSVCNSAALDLPQSPKSLLPDLSGPIDMQSSLRAAIDAYQANRFVYDEAAQGRLPDKFESLPAIPPLLDASMSRSETVLAPFAAEVVTFKTSRPPLDAIRALGEATVRAALDREQSDPGGATGDYNAMLALGEKLYNERLIFEEAEAGMMLMSESAQRLARLAHRPDRAAALLNFERARREFYTQRIAPVWAVLGSVDPNVITAHAGDLFTIARDAPERMWRVEATLAIGRSRFSAPRPRDRFRAEQVLDEMSASESDSMVRQAAIAARAMRIEDFRMLH